MMPAMMPIFRALCRPDVSDYWSRCFLMAFAVMRHDIIECVDQTRVSTQYCPSLVHNGVVLALDELFLKREREQFFCCQICRAPTQLYRCGACFSPFDSFCSREWCVSLGTFTLSLTDHICSQKKDWVNHKETFMCTISRNMLALERI